MDKQELIKKIIEDVKDEKLKNELLKQVVNAGDNDSLILKELSRIGFNPEGTKEYVGFQMKIGIIVGYIVASLFMFGGGLFALGSLLQGEFGSALFASIFGIFGLMAFINTNKMRRMGTVK